MILRRVVRVFALAFASGTTVAIVAACGGSPNTPSGSYVGSPGGHAPPPTQLVGVKLTVSVSPGGSAGMRPSYVSPNTQSVSVQLASVDGNGVTGVNASIVNTAPKSPNCKVEAGAVVCTATISGSPGSDVFTVATYEGLDATGSVLSAGTAAAHIAGGGGGLQISNRMSIDIDGQIAKLKLSVSPNRVKRGKAASAVVSVVAFDASGAQIVGSSNYQIPIRLSIQGDTSGSFALHAGRTLGESLSIEKPTANIGLTYDGNERASSITLAATDGSSGVNAPFALQGHKPPPPAGTIYALNLGTKDGQGATVTEYDAKASGNAAPLRTLNLSSKLYARSIAVDSAGNLYVGFFDSSLGFTPSGSPDGGNLVAVYAPGAGGNDPPVATLVADRSSGTSLFPLFSTIDAAGGLVAYGATKIDRNGGNDAILTYAQGASGQQAPDHGLNFAFPTIDYPGPTGLALDGLGNLYFAGALHSGLGPSFCICIAAAADIGNPQASPSRTIPYDDTTGLMGNETTNVGLDDSSEILVGNELVHDLSSNVSCQGRVSVFAAGATGGVTDNPPLRVIVLDGVYTQNPDCVSFQSPLQPYFPEIALHGSTLFVADDFNNAIGEFPSSRGGTIKSTRRIAGPATGLDAPVAVAVASSSSSDRAATRPVRNGRTQP